MDLLSKASNYLSSSGCTDFCRPLLLFILRANTIQGSKVDKLALDQVSSSQSFDRFGLETLAKLSAEIAELPFAEVCQALRRVAIKQLLAEHLLIRTGRE